jgi:hypothetical protein
MSRVRISTAAPNVNQTEEVLVEMRGLFCFLPLIYPLRRCWTSAKWDGFGNREIRLVSTASTGDNKAETSRRTNITSGTGYGGRSRIMINWAGFSKSV